MTTDIRELNSRLGAPGRVSILLVLIAAIVLFSSIGGLGKAFLTPSAEQVKHEQDARFKQLAADYSKTLEQQSAQFTGRSIFFTPSAPPPPLPPPPPPVENKEPPPPPPPATYQGPKLIAMVNGVAWFEDGQRLEPGQKGDSGLILKEIKAPWDVIVTWKDKEFTVSLFDRDKIVNPPPETPKSESQPETKPEAKEEPKEEPKTEPADSSEPKPEEPKPEDPKPAGDPQPNPQPNPQSPPDTPAPDSPAPPPPPAPTGAPDQSSPRTE